MISGLYCRLSAPGRSPAALKGQKAPQFKIICRRSALGLPPAALKRQGTPQIKSIAAEVPLDSLQRHSSGRNPLKSKDQRTGKVSMFHQLQRYSIIPVSENKLIEQILLKRKSRGKENHHDQNRTRMPGGIPRTYARW